MAKNRNIITKLSDHIRKLSIGKNDYEYAITFGMISSFFVFIKGLFLFVIMDPSDFLDPVLFVVYLIVIMCIFVVMTLVHADVIKHQSKFSQTVVLLYPFILSTLVIFSAFIYDDFIHQLSSFAISMIVISLIRIYSNKERNLIFSYSFIMFNTIYILYFGWTQYKADIFAISFMAGMMSYLSAWLHALIYKRQKNTIKSLDDNYKELELAVNALELTNRQLKQSHNVTASMLKMSREVLRNESIDAVLQIVLDEALSLIPHAQAGSILILKEDDKMEYVAARGYRLENLKRVQLKYQDLYQANLSDPYEPTIIQDLEVFDEVHIGREKTDQLFTEAAKIAKSCLTCSFMYDGKFYGSINIDNFDSRDIYTEHDKYLLKQLAQELEIIISIHVLYEKAIRPTKFDELTQAKTRRYSMKLLQQMIDDDKKKHICICTIDINQLKSINDRFGHDAGDRYLIFFADAVRKAKIKNNIFGRIGGDEFLLIFDNITIEECHEQILIIKDYLDKHPYKTNGYTGPVTFSAGVSFYPDDGDDLGELIKISDRRMYMDKNPSQRNDI